MELASPSSGCEITRCRGVISSKYGTVCLFSFFTDLCLSTLYILAFTSGAGAAGSDSHHSVEILANGQVRNVHMYDRPGNDMLENKGDLWKINFGSFYFSDSCINIGDIQTVSIIESGNDGWNIDSIVTMVKDSAGGVQVLTQDLDVFRWVDGDAHHTHRRFTLTKA